MVNMNDLRDIIDDNILNEMYIARNSKLSEITESDKEKLKKLNTKLENDYKNIISNLKNTNGISEENIKVTKKLIEEYVDDNIEITSYFGEKLYKTGVADGIKLMLEKNNF